MSKVSRISATDAKTRFGELIRRVQVGRNTKQENRAPSDEVVDSLESSNLNF